MFVDNLSNTFVIMFQDSDYSAVLNQYLIKRNVFLFDFFLSSKTSITACRVCVWCELKILNQGLHGFPATTRGFNFMKTFGRRYGVSQFTHFLEPYSKRSKYIQILTHSLKNPPGTSLNGSVMFDHSDSQL